MEYMAIIITAGADWKMSTSYGSLPISNKIGATTDARGEERQDKGDQACEVMRELECVCYKMSRIDFFKPVRHVILHHHRHPCTFVLRRGRDGAGCGRVVPR